jgi:hypothetical protein
MIVSAFGRYLSQTAHDHETQRRGVARVGAKGLEGRESLGPVGPSGWLGW